MTERTASGRALGALKAIGMEEAPLTTLEREDALFVLTGQTLVYQDGGGTRRVTLRDLTRIHSDEQGMLRVETPAGTALTASLLGFDVPGVQAFFAQVRDTTARAKDMPVSPLPAPGALKTFGASAAPPNPATPNPAPPNPTPPRPEAGQERAADDVAPVRQQPVAQQPASQQPGSLQPAPAPPPATLASADQRSPISPPREAQTPVKDVPQAETVRPQAADSERPNADRPSADRPSADRSASESSSPQPVVMQKSPGEGTQGQKAEPAAPGNGRAPLPPLPNPATPQPASGQPASAQPISAQPASDQPVSTQPTSIRPAPSQSATPKSTPAPAAPPGSGLAAAVAARPVVISSSAFTPTPARAATPAAEPSRVTPESAPPATPASARSAPSAPVTPPQTLDGLHRTLGRQADVVGDLVGRLRFLGGVLFAAALLLATVQYTADARLDALWTLLSGGVGTIALLALAELARLLALLGRSVALSAGAPAPATPAPGAPGGATDAR